MVDAPMWLLIGFAVIVGANNRALLDAAVKYVRRNPPEKFLEAATPLLTDAQRMCIMVNMIDSALSDGQPEPEEQMLIGKFQKAFGITDERFQPFFEVIVMKHGRSVFTDANHPSNQPGFQVSLAGLR